MADFFGGFAGGAELVFGLGDAEGEQVLHDAGAELFFKDTGKIKFIDMIALG